MATSSSSPIASPKSSPPSSIYVDAAESLTEKIQPSLASNNKSVGGRRTSHTRGYLSSSASNSTHGKAPYPAHKPTQKQKTKSRITVRYSLYFEGPGLTAAVSSSKKSQSERYIYSGSMNDNAMNTIIEQLEANLETYTEIQAQEALDLSRSSRGVIHAEEVYTIGRLVEGRVQMRALENKVVEVKNRLRIADLQLTFLRKRLETYGFALSEEDPEDFIGRLQKKPLLHVQLSASDVAQLSSLPPDGPLTATDLILQEPVSKPDVSTWMRGTLPNENHEDDVSADDNEGSTSSVVVLQ